MCIPQWPTQWSEIHHHQWLVEITLLIWLILLSPRSEWNRSFLLLQCSTTHDAMDSLVSKSAKIASMSTSSPMTVFLPALIQVRSLTLIWPFHCRFPHGQLCTRTYREGKWCQRDGLFKLLKSLNLGEPTDIVNAFLP
jgi:hypothetical protein